MSEPAARPRIFAFVAAVTVEQVGSTFDRHGRLRPRYEPRFHGRALAEDGTLLDAKHQSSSADWSRYDMGADGGSTWQHEVYGAHYPGGFVVEWVAAPDAHPVVGPRLRDPRGGLVRSPGGWRPIGEARFVDEGTVADLLVANGDIVRATWAARDGLLGGSAARATMWWPSDGRGGIPLYTPLFWRPVPAATLASAARALLDACVADMSYGEEGDGPYDDDEAVASGTNGESAVTFGHLRRLRGALALHDRAEAASEGRAP